MTDIDEAYAIMRELGHQIDQLRQYAEMREAEMTKQDLIEAKQDLIDLWRHTKSVALKVNQRFLQVCEFMLPKLKERAGKGDDECDTHVQHIEFNIAAIKEEIATLKRGERRWVH